MAGEDDESVDDDELDLFEDEDELDAGLLSQPTEEPSEEREDEKSDAESTELGLEDEDEELEDIAEKDKLAYERLLMEGADVEKVEDEMKSMDETLAAVQETYLDGSIYNSAQEAPKKPRKKLEDFPYPPMPEFSMQLSELLEKAEMKSEAERLLEQWDDVKVTGLQSHAQNIKPGDVFFAKKTANYNGVQDIPLAVENGAVAIVFEHGNEAVEGSEMPSVDTDLENGTNASVNSTESKESTGDISKSAMDWRCTLEAEGIPVDEIEIAAPIFPVVSLNFSMSALGAVFYGFPASKMKIFGVVGSHGKTSTAWILRQILEEFKKCTGLITDIEYAILDHRLTAEGDLFIPTEDDPAYLRRAATPYHLTPFRGRYSVDEAVPDALQVQKLLAGMVYRGAEACIVECPIEALGEGRLLHVDFDVLIYTNLQSETLDTAESFEAKKKLTAELFAEMQIPEGQRAIINMDDPHAQDLIDKASEAPVVTYSLSNTTADVYAEQATYSIWESELVIRTPLGRIQVITPMIGSLNVYNILASVAAAVAVDVDLSTIVTGYHSSEERAAMGNAAHFYADVVIITSDSPAGEAPDRIIDDIVAGFPEDVLSRSALWVHSPWQDPGRVPWWFEEWLFRAQTELRRHIVEDRSFAIRGAIGTARKGDVVVVAGRGAQDYSWWVDKDDQPFKTWYEDRLEVRDSLQKLPHLHKSQVVTDRLPWSEPEMQTAEPPN